MSNYFTSRHKVALYAVIALAAVAVSSPAFAQGGGFGSTSQAARKGLGDGSSFYMARRQIEVVDDSPIVKYSGGGAAGGAAAGFGSQQRGGGMAPLQRAGFTSYSSSLPQSSAPALPKVNNGVPVPVVPPKLPKSTSARAGSLGKTKSVSVKPAAAPDNGIHAYNSYKGYNPSASLPYVPAGGEAQSSQSTKSNVKGSVLHWSRRRSGQ